MELDASIYAQVVKLNKLLVPTIQNVANTVPVYGNSASAGTVYEFLKYYMGLNGSAFSTPLMETRSYGWRPNWCATAGLFMLDNHSTPSGLLTCSYNPTTDSFNTEDTVKGLQSFMEDNSGVMWGVSNKASYYGLYKRTGVGTWTLVLADTAATGYIARWTNGTLYYISSASNWYSLTSGAVTVSSDPSAGAYSGWWQYTFSNSYGDQRQTGYIARGAGGAQSPLDLSASGAWSETADQFYIWQWPQKTRVMPKSKTLWNLAGSIPYTSNIPIAYIQVANSNYFLGLLVVPNTVNGANYVTVSAVLCNFSTGNEQYLGTYQVPYIYAYTGGGSSYYTQAATAVAPGMVPQFAYMSGGLINLYWLGLPYAYSAAYTGVFKQVITAQITI